MKKERKGEKENGRKTKRSDGKRMQRSVRKDEGRKGEERNTG